MISDSKDVEELVTKISNIRLNELISVQKEIDEFYQIIVKIDNEAHYETEKNLDFIKMDQARKVSIHQHHSFVVCDLENSAVGIKRDLAAAVFFVG